MRFAFKTSYDQDIRLAEHSGHILWYGLLGLLMLAAPLLLKSYPYWLSQLAFVLIYSIVGLGLMLLVGFTGQLSLGHAAFLGVGAYTEAIMINAGFPFPLALCSAAAASLIAGAVLGLPALRLRGFYLAIATLAFSFIIEEVLARWERFTGGSAGLRVNSPEMFGIPLDTAANFYFVCLALATLVVLFVANLMRTATGRAFLAIRDSEISAQSMGIHLAYYKTLSFAISAGIAGIGGALYAHALTYISPDQFGIANSIDLLLMVVIGGVGYLHGAFAGALFLIVVPELIANFKYLLPEAIGNAPGLKAVIYSAALVTVVLFEPLGLYGRWIKIRTWFELFPVYRRGMFKRRKSYQKSERLK